MRIQHNIMAMSAYRNYSNNTSAVAKNLERLSSGYKINRAGDDAAGLAISEKMRAQITGLNAAQKNVKDGISLVKTSEGAMQEIQDMLNRMDYLATQSANGTYQDDVDREALQNEVEQLRKEINRIAESANFNGIKLLDGSLEAGGGGTTIKGFDRIIANVLGAGEDPIANTGVKTILDGGSNASKATKFDVDFTGLAATKGDGTPAGAATYTPDAGNQVDGITATVDADDATAGAVKVKVDKITTATKSTAAGADALQGATFGYDTAGSAGNFNIKLVGDGATDAAAWDATTNTLTITLNKAGGATTGELTAAELQGKIQALTATGTGAPDCSKITVTGTLGAPLDVTAAGDLGTIALAGGADANDMKVTLTTAAGAYTETVKAADWTGTVNITGDNGLSAAIDTAKITTNVAEKTIGTVTAGAAAVPGADSQISFKIGGTALATDVTVTAAAADGKATPAEIADAVFGGIAGAGTEKEVTINGAKWKVTNGGNGKLSFELKDAPTATNIKGNFDWDVSMKDATGKFTGNHTAGTTVTEQGQVGAAGSVANTVFQINKADLADGTTITLDGKTVTLAVGADSKFKNAANVIDLTNLDPANLTDADLNTALGKIAQGIGDTTNFIVGVNDKSNGDTNIGLTVHKKDSSTQTYDTKEKLAAVFSMATAGTGKPLTLQIGDTSENFNQMDVNIKDMHTTAMGTKGGKSIADINIGTQAGATEAVNVIKDAINYVSSVRGDLGAIQNRLEHTANNLSVMAENIQDAESSIRDTDIAEEMMAYTKNNILVQSAQAMLAQANQVPQGVLQLLG